MIVFIVLTSNRNPTISAHTTARAVKNLHRQHGFELMCVWTTLFMSAMVGALSVVVVLVIVIVIIIFVVVVVVVVFFQMHNA